MTKQAQTKEVKQILAGLIVRLHTDTCGTIIRGHGDELIRAKAKLEETGAYEVVEMGDLLNAARI